MKTITPMLPEIAAQLCEQKHLLRKFESALIAADLDALCELCPKIDEAFIWPRAWRRVAHLKQELSGDVKRFFLAAWAQYGDHLRQEAGSDLLLIEALRRLLPPY